MSDSIVFGNPDAGIAFGNPDVSPNIAFGIPGIEVSKTCSVGIQCPCSDNPFANLSSEDLEDQRIIHGSAQSWCASGFGCDGSPFYACSTISQDDADVQLANELFLYNRDNCPPPPLKQYCATASCPGGTLVTACSDISQQDAQNAVSELVSQTPCPPAVPDPSQPFPDRVFYYNHEESCQIHCPDGSPFTYTVRANRYIAATQAQADAIAASAACKLAKQHIMCLSSLVEQWCAGVAFSKTIKASNANYGTNNFWQITGGSLPDGLTANTGYGGNSLLISGTPTTPGSFSFTVQISNPVGDYMAKTYTICIVGCTSNPAGSDDTHLPQATNLISYTVTLQAPACTTGTTVFTIPMGGLPDGLTLDSVTGIISGTPDDDVGDYVFTVEVNSSITCRKQWTLTIGDTVDIGAYWTLDSITGIGDFPDSTPNGVTLQAGSAVPQLLAPGLIGNGAKYTDTDGIDFDSIVSPSLNYVHGNGFSMWGWFKCIHIGDASVLGGPSVACDTFGFSLGLFVGSNTDPQPLRILAPPLDTDYYVPIVEGAWYFFHLFYDPSVQKCGYSLNNGPKIYFPTAFVPVSSQGTVSISQGFVGGGGDPGSMIFDEIGIITSQMLTATQQTYLYNLGLGRTWPIALPP